MDVADILEEFGAHGFDDLEEVIKLNVLNETYQDACARFGWPFLERRITLTFDGTNGAPSNMPADFRAAIKMRGSDNRRWLPVRDDDDVEIGGNTGAFVYHIQAGVFTVSPVPSASVTAVLSYLMYPDDLDDTVLEDDIVLPARYHRGILVNGGLYKLYALEDDTDLSATFERLYEKAISRAQNDLWRWQYDQPDYIHQTDDSYSEW